jgi:multidrug resistance efflux pump
MNGLCRAVVLAASLAACSGAADRFAYSGTLQALSAGVGSTIGGRVVAVDVQDGAAVHKGDIIVRFNARQQVAAFDAASAQEAQARAALQDLVAGPRPADIQKAADAAAQADATYQEALLGAPQQSAAATQAVRAARADLRAARAAAIASSRDRQRAAMLYSQGAISAQAMDAASAAAVAAAGSATAAAARLRTALASEQAVRAGTVAAQVDVVQKAAAAADANLALVKEGARPDQIVQARSALAAAAANVAAARAALDETAVRAPADGVVDGLDLHPGDLVPAGAPVATIDESADPWVRIYVAQSDLHRFAIGKSVDVRSDAVAGRTFSGRVEVIDASAQFTPRDVQTASDRADLAFGVKVVVHDPGHALRSGTTVEVAPP